jgi:hypothetical protein
MAISNRDIADALASYLQPYPGEAALPADVTIDVSLH